METIRTTLRLNKGIKKAAEKKALDENITLQKLFNRALYSYITKENKKSAHKVIFHDKPISRRMNNLTREEVYD